MFLGCTGGPCGKIKIKHLALFRTRLMLTALVKFFDTDGRTLQHE